MVLDSNKLIMISLKKKPPPSTSSILENITFKTSNQRGKSSSGNRKRQADTRTQLIRREVESNIGSRYRNSASG